MKKNYIYNGLKTLLLSFVFCFIFNGQGFCQEKGEGETVVLSESTDIAAGRYVSEKGNFIVFDEKGQLTSASDKRFTRGRWKKKADGTLVFRKGKKSCKKDVTVKGKKSSKEEDVIVKRWRNRGRRPVLPLVLSKKDSKTITLTIKTKMGDFTQAFVKQ